MEGTVRWTGPSPGAWHTTGEAGTSREPNLGDTIVKVREYQAFTYNADVLV